MEQHGSRRKTTDFRRGKKLGERDHIITMNKPKKRPDWMDEKSYADAPDTVKIREFRAGGKVMVTTLMNLKEATKNELKMLYKDRWKVELDIRDIKTTMGMNILSCKTPDMVEKEIWIYLLAYNFIRLLMTVSALLLQIKPRTISFKHSVQIWFTWAQDIAKQRQNKLVMLLFLIAEKRVGNRPNRIEPRAVKRRPKPYPLLTKPRALARQDVVKRGHPKKS